MTWQELHHDAALRELARVNAIVTRANFRKGAVGPGNGPADSPVGLSQPGTGLPPSGRLH